MVNIYILFCNIGRKCQENHKLQSTFHHEINILELCSCGPVKREVFNTSVPNDLTRLRADLYLFTFTRECQVK